MQIDNFQNCLCIKVYSGEGLVAKDVENTICNIGSLARNGMAATDKKIIRIMPER